MKAHSTMLEHDGLTGHGLTGYGAMSSTMCDHVYVPAAHAQIYTSPSIVARVTTPFDILLAFTACRKPITIQIDNTATIGNALVAPPRARGMHAEAVRLVLIQLCPMHPDYRLFRDLKTIQQLNRDHFTRFDSAFDAAYRGELSLSGAQELYDGVLTEVTRQFPARGPLDARVRNVMQLLWADPRLSVEHLAAQSDLSYDRMSHLFIDELGISIRSFQVWVKLYRALSGIRYGQSLIELAKIAGFSDAAHLSRVYKQVYGAPPSYFYFSGKVKLIASFALDVPSAPELRKAHP